MKIAPVDEEYKKNKNLKPEDVKSLINWLEMQPHLPKISELQTILFLHSVFYSNESAKNVIDTYYTCRTHCPEFFDKRDPFGSIQKEFDNLICYECPYLTEKNERVCYIKLNSKDTSKFNFGEILKVFCMFVDLWLLRNGTAEGHIIMLDFENLQLGHLPKLSFMHLKKFMLYLQDAIPFRLKGVHVVNVVPFIDKLMALLKPFLKKELLDVLVFHTDGFDSLYKFVPKKSLPQHLGGEGASPSGMLDIMKRDFKDNAEYFKEELKQRIDETKRQGKGRSAGDLFGVEGSFKKLDID